MLYIHRILAEALKHAVGWQLAARNVALAVTPPKIKRQEMHTLTAEQANQLLAAAASSPYHDLFSLAIWTGMRRSELVGLRCQDVDLDIAQLSVNQTVHRVPSCLVIQPPKTARSRRTVALPPIACVLLRQRKQCKSQEAQQLGTTLQDTDYVFARLDGNPIDPDGVTHAFARIIKKAGLPHVRFHDLRHSHASLMLKLGIHPKIVSERLGHSNIGITLDVYSHVMPGLQEAAAKRLEDALLGAPQGEAHTPVLQ